MKRWLIVFVMILLLLTNHERYGRYSVTFWGAFDTMITITANAESQQKFDTLTEAAISRFTELSKYYDRFSESDTIVNIATLNRKAGRGKLKVSKELFDLLSFSQQGIKRTEYLVTPTFGPVTELWRKQIIDADYGKGAPPDKKILIEASKNTSPKLLKLNEETQTVELLFSNVVLDVGAFAKGYATEIVGKELVAAGLSRLAISSGGNIRVFLPPDGKLNWSIGVQDPNKSILNNSKSIGTLLAYDLAIATSGDYQRYFWYDGKRYHHLIDPVTLYPAQYFRSVTVACNDAGEADLFSTALFLVDYEKGKELAEKEKLAVLWVMPDGSVRTNERMSRILKK